MPTCPAGHDSTTSDYCDTCGARMPADTLPAGVPASAGSADARPAADEPCPDCGAPRTGRFCEECGHDFTTGTPGVVPAPLSAPVQASAAPEPAPAPVAAEPDPEPEPTAPTGWVAEVAADRAYYETIRAAGNADVKFPPYCPERRIHLTGVHVRIGRRSSARGLTPEIDLAGPPEDPGVSHLHALLLPGDDGSLALVDPGSTNGTTVNSATEPVEVNAVVPLADGDRIHVGVWTTITVRRLAPTP